MGLTRPFAITLDLDLGHMYWADSSAGTITRADLDGSDVTVILSGLSDPRGIALLVPGPSAALVTVFGLLGLAMRRRRAR